MPLTRILNTIYIASSTAQMGTVLPAPARVAGKVLYLYAVDAEDQDNDAQITVFLEESYRQGNTVALVPTTDTIKDFGVGWSGKIPFEKPMCLRGVYNNHVSGDRLSLQCLVGE